MKDVLKVTMATRMKPAVRHVHAQKPIVTLHVAVQCVTIWSTAYVNQDTRAPCVISVRWAFLVKRTVSMENATNAIAIQMELFPTNVMS